MDFGFISVYIDDFTPCLKDNITGELVDTEVIRIKRSSYMQKNYTPIDVNSLPYFVDMKAMRNYAKEKGVSISSLTDSEKEQFTKRNLSNIKVSNL